MVSKKTGTEVCLDELPFGYFLEIEGSPKEIEKTIKELGLEQNERLAKSYLGVFEDWKLKNKVKSKHAIFKK